MRIEGNPTKPEFKPVRVTFTFESQKELDVFGSLFNTSRLGDKIRELAGIDNYFYEAFEEVGARTYKYIEDFKQLCRHSD